MIVVVDDSQQAADVVRCILRQLDTDVLVAASVDEVSQQLALVHTHAVVAAELDTLKRVATLSPSTRRVLYGAPLDSDALAEARAVAHAIVDASVGPDALLRGVLTCGAPIYGEPDPALVVAWSDVLERTQNVVEAMLTEGTRRPDPQHVADRVIGGMQSLASFRPEIEREAWYYASQRATRR